MKGENMLDKVVSELVEIKFNIMQLEARKTEIMRLLSEKHPTPKEAAPTPKKKSRKKAGWTYYARKKAAERCKRYFSSLTAEQRAELIAKRLATRMRNKGTTK